MRVLLVSPGQPPSLYSMSETADITGCAAFMPNIALPTLAALAPDWVDVTMVDDHIDAIDSYLEQRWDVVGITGYMTQRVRMFELAQAFRCRGQLVAIGGPYATLSSSTVRSHADILFTGEAEQTWPEFLADFRAGSWKTEYRASNAVDLNTSPIPAMGGLRNEAYLAGIVQTSRGCPFECEFCDVIVYLGRRQRYKTPERVIEELEQLYQLGYRDILLADDNFTAHRKQAKSILEAIRQWNRCKPERVVLATQLSIDAAGDPELLDLAEEAGLRQAFIGIETPSHEALREAKKRQNVRANLIPDIRMFQRRGIAVQAGIVTGFDADTKDSFRVLLEFLQEAGVPSVLANMLMAPEGTPLERRLRAEHRLRTPDLQDGYTGTNIIPKQMTARQLHYGTQWLLNKLYAPRGFLERVAVLAEHSPKAAGPVPWRSSRSVTIWQNLLRAYEALGPELRRVPREAVRLFHGKDGTVLATALVFHIHNVRILQKQGLWDVALAELEAPDFESLGEADGLVV
ncbi:MAG: radical SAM protein [Candidatus Binatia bacterium]